MAVRTPGIKGLALGPNAAGDINNPAASPQELEVGSFWGRYATITDLPNTSGNLAVAPAYTRMRPGDLAWVQSTQRLYVLESRGTSGGGDAIWLVVASVGGGSPLVWGAFSLTNTTTTRYLFSGGATASGTAPTAPRQYRIPHGGAFKNLRIHQNTPVGNGNLIVYTVRINNVPTALFVSMACTAADGSNLVTVLTVAAGDLIDIEVTKAASTGAGGGQVTVLASMELA